MDLIGLPAQTPVTRAQFLEALDSYIGAVSKTIRTAEEAKAAGRDKSLRLVYAIQVRALVKLAFPEEATFQYEQLQDQTESTPKANWSLGYYLQMRSAMTTEAAARRK